jgi:hypothetical protein
MKGSLASGLYILQGSTVSGEAAVASGSNNMNQTQLWHLRLGHMSERGLSVLSKRDLLDGQKTESMDFCEHCVFGK